MGFQIGDRASLSKTITDADVRMFAELTLDTNPLHLDDDYAATTRFGRRVVHGMFSTSLISAVLGTALPGAGAIYLSQTIKFIGPVFVGDTVTAHVEVHSLAENKPIATFKTWCQNQYGDDVLTGEATMMIQG
jgi:3-hydroxybutyryl-CoA dehydratase